MADTRLFDPAELVRNPPAPPAWLVPGVLPCGWQVMWSGLAKTGKSILAKDLALVLASGGRWLDLELEGGRKTLYVDEEMSLTQVAERFMQLCNARKLAPETFEGKITYANFALAQFRSHEKTRQLGLLCDRLKPDLVVVDTLKRMLPPLPGIYSDPVVMSHHVVAMRIVVGQSCPDATTLILDHLPKDRRRQDRPAGTEGIAGAIDWWWTLKLAHGGNPENRDRIFAPGSGRYLGKERKCRITGTFSKDDNSYKITGNWQEIGTPE